MADVTMRLRALDLPHPIHPLLDSVLSADNVDARHEDLVNAWEAVLKVTACTMWAVRRAVGVRSSAFDDQCRGLARPAFGHWAGLVREGHLLLRDRPEAETLALRPLCEGLERRLDDFPGLAALAALLPEAPKGGVRVEGLQLQALAQALSSYRNVTKGHEPRDSSWRERANDALWNALLDWCEACPPTGSARVVVVHDVTHEGPGRVARLARMHGHGQPKERRPVSRETADLLRPGRPFLFAEPELFVPLFPVAAAEPDGDRWRLGWLKERVREPRFAFDAFPAGSFQVRLDTEDYLALMGATNAGEDPVLPDTVLALDPWQGLPAYDERHAPVFFGREEETESAVARLRRDGCLLLCGASGAGKSSLMKAGVLARLREEAERDGVGLSLVSFAPGPAPIEALRGALRAVDPGPAVDPASWWSLIDQFLPAGAPRNGCDGLRALATFLARNGHRVVVAIDQMEEAATLCTDPAQRTRFLGLVAEAGQHAREAQAFVVATVRADLLGGLLEHPDFRALADGRMLLLGGMGRERLRRVVTDPLRGRGVELEPGLDEVIAFDVGDEPGSLALLSQVLRTLWDERTLYGRRLTREGYESAGRVAGALRRQADQARAEALVLSRADASNPAAADLDRVLLQLAQAGGDRTFSRRVVRQADIAAATGLDATAVRALLEPFIARRMLVSGGGEASDSDVVAVAHEALFTAWPHFRELLQAREEALVLRGQVEAAADAWERSGRRRELWTDGTSRLRRAEELQAEGRLDLGERERAFLTACRNGVQRRRRLGWMVSGALALLLVAAVAAGWVAMVKTRTAKEQTRVAMAQREEARTLASSIMEEQGRVELLAGHPMRALLYLAEAYRENPSKPSTRYLVAEATRQSIDVRLANLDGHSAVVRSAAFSPDGSRVVTASKDRTAAVWDVASGRRLTVLEGHSGPVWSAIFNYDETRIVTASSDNTAALWDVASGLRLMVLKGHSSPVRSAIFNYDGTRVLTTGGDKAALWDAASGRRLAVLEEDFFKVESAAFSPDGTRIVTAFSDDTGALWDTASGRRIALLEGYYNRVESAGYGPDGTQIVTVNSDGTAALWDAATGRRLVVLGERFVRSAAFSPDGTRIVTADGNKATLWDAATSHKLEAFEGHSDDVYSAAFSPDGTQVVTASSDKTAALWDTATGRRLAALEDHLGPVVSAVFNNDGTRVLTVSGDRATLWKAPSDRRTCDISFDSWASLASAALSPDKTRIVTVYDNNKAALWDATTGRRLWDLGERNLMVESAAFSPDGTQVVTVGLGKAALWSTLTGARLAVLNGHSNPVLSAAFSADGTRVVTASSDKTAALWDAATGRRIAVLEGHSDSVLSSLFSPDGTRVVTASSDKTAALWDAATGRRIAVLAGHYGKVDSAAFNPDGTRVLTASSDNTAALWDAATARRIAVLAGHSGKVNSATFNPDGTRVLTASSDNTATLWDAATGRRIAVMKGGELSVAFSPDGPRFLTVGVDNAVLWDAATGRRIAALEGHSNRLSSAALSPDGTLVVTMSLEEPPVLWDAATGRRLAVFGGRLDWCSSAAFSSDGTHVMTTGFGGKRVTLWDLHLETRSPDEIDRLIRCKLPIRLVDGVIDRVEPDPEACNTR